MTTSSKPRFLSLKWKTALLFGLMLIIFNGLFPVLVYWNLHEKFEFSRKQVQQQFEHELVGQLKNTSEQIQRMAEISLIPQAAHSNENILNSITLHQSKLELDWHITQAQIFASSTENLGGFGDDPSAKVESIIDEVLRTESALTFIDCSQSCQQYDLIPILHSSQTIHVLLLAYNLSSTLLNFSTKTAADIAVLSNPVHSTVSSERQLSNWKMEVAALTSYSENIHFLQKFSQLYSFEEFKIANKVVRDSSLPVEFKLVNFENNSDITFVIIDDVTEQQQEIINITLRSIAISLLSVLLLGFGLFFYISRPLSRLSTVSEALPLLAKQKYNTVKKLLQVNVQGRHIDELDQLESSTHELSEQLELLQNTVKERSLTLHSRSVELKQERDFVKSLIDTAQVIIITTDHNCKITSFNDFAERTTGYLEKNILNSSFQLFFPNNEWTGIEQTLITLRKSPSAVNRHESEFINSDGSIRIISWLHSSLKYNSNSPVVLSVGLDITEQKQSDDKIIWLADHDALTKLYNRRKFNLEFDKVLNQAMRFKQDGMLLFLDLDQFKDLNDIAGHKSGDLALKQIARLLTSITRTTDITARLGGDEFAIILPKTNANGAITLAEKISQHLLDLELFFQKTRYKITASIGIVKFPLSDLSVDELISNADLAMYQAKSLGKNTWYQFALDDQSRRQLDSRIFWKQKIEHAIDNHHFIFHYQPIMEIASRTVSHYEMLIRMQDEDGTIHPPATFIEVAEQTGLIHNIDHYVLQQGIIKQAELDDKGLCLSLNLSAYAITDPVLFSLLKQLLTDHKSKPGNLIFELTETAAVADIQQAKELMLRIKTIGCRFSLDDFGTGFASFRYMRELPVDIVKIDGEFISNLVHSPDDQLFVKALVDIAKGMGKKTIAEFVEDAETLALLDAFGVDYAQGYYIGKPKADFLTQAPQLD